MVLMQTPKARYLLARPRISRLFKSGLQHPLFLIEAPSGYGKTTAVKTFLTAGKTPHFYTRLFSSDETLFWEEFLTGLGKISPILEEKCRVIGYPCTPTAIQLWVKAIAAHCRQGFIMAIDDFQALETESKVDHFFEALVGENLPHFRLIILSRRSPKFPLATWLSKALLFRLSKDDLAFTPSEVEAYLQLRGLHLSPAIVQQVVARAQGWISALYLLSEGILTQGSLNPSKDIAGLLEENLLSNLSSEQKEALIRLSEFEVFPLTLVTPALGYKEAESLVAKLAQENAFLSESEPGLYAFHPLLREYLQSLYRLDEEQKQVCLRAGLWYLKHPRYRYFFSVSLFAKADAIATLLQVSNAPGHNPFSLYDHAQLAELMLSLPQENALLYPYPYLHFIFYLLLAGETHNRDFALGLLDFMKRHFSLDSSLQGSRIYGELSVIEAVIGLGDSSTPDLLLKAAKLLHHHPSEILSPNDPYTFGLPMLLDSEYTQSGHLALDVERCQRNNYELVCPGFGQGSPALAKAEAFLLQGTFAQVRPYATEACEEAQEKKQYFIALSAEFTLLRLALDAGFPEDGRDALKAMEGLLMEAEREWQPDYRLSLEALRKGYLNCRLFYEVMTDQTPEGTALPSEFDEPDLML